MKDQNRTHDKRRTNALADTIAGLDDPSLGDEREREVILRAYTFASVISTFVLLGLAVIFAVIGAGLWSALLILSTGIVGGVVCAYCHREGVDFALTLARVRPRRMVATQLASLAFALAWLAAITFHQMTGHPLIEAGLGVMPQSDSAWSLIVGGIGTIIVLTLARRRTLARARKEAETAADIEDED